MDLHDQIRQLHGPPYLPVRADWRDQRILHPHIGGHFALGAPARLRVMALGINSYVKPDKTTHPGWFSAWFRNQEHRFFPAVAQQLRELTSTIREQGGFPGLAFEGAAPHFPSVYLTNAVRRYLPESIGQKAHLVPEGFLKEGAKVFGAELELLAANDLLPHIVVVFGKAGWARAWSAFGREPRPPWVVAYAPRARGSDLYHRLNVVSVTEGGGTRPLLLLRLTHPAARTKRWRAAEVTAHPDFRSAIAELGERS